MKIAILGWGSLLWDRQPDFDEQRRSLNWEPDGPTLKIEFSRVSDKRGGALTLVIDESTKTDVRVSWCESKRRAIDDAVCDLQRREGTIRRNIGVLDLSTSADRDNQLASTIRAWAIPKRLDAVVWTALKSNFEDEDKAGKPFSVDSALEYLRDLSPQGQARAAEYIARAPDFVKTPLRAAVQREEWFMALNKPGEPNANDARGSASGSSATRLSEATREWLAELAFQVSRTAADGTHPCRDVALHLITEWLLWRWTADKEVSNLVQLDGSKYDTDTHDATDLAREAAAPHRSKRRISGLSHHHVVPRGALAAKLMLAQSKNEVLQILENDCKAKITTKPEHDAIHRKTTEKAQKKKESRPTR